MLDRRALLSMIPAPFLALVGIVPKAQAEPASESRQFVYTLDEGYLDRVEMIRTPNFDKIEDAKTTAERIWELRDGLIRAGYTPKDYSVVLGGAEEGANFEDTKRLAVSEYGLDGCYYDQNASAITLLPNNSVGAFLCGLIAVGPERNVRVPRLMKGWKNVDVLSIGAMMRAQV